MTSVTWIVAYNIHTGGGAILLNELLRSVNNEDANKFFLIRDERFNYSGLLKQYSVKPNILSRLKCEYYIYRESKRKNIRLLFFGNLPPLFPVRGDITVYLQNKYLVIPSLKNKINFKSYIRCALEQLWFRYRLKPNMKIWVQTKSMKEELSLYLAELGESNTVFVKPFLPRFASAKHSVLMPEKVFDYIYVSNFEEHKNHKRLIDAWNILKQDFLVSPSLLLITDENGYDALECMLATTYQGLNVKILFNQNRDQVFNSFQNSKALIFPSTLESFGLPLLEAQSLNIDILASDLDFTYDVCKPSQVFNPFSSRSIARAVLRHLNIVPNPVDIPNADYLVSELVNHN